MDGAHTTVLVADADPATRAFLLDNLAADGYTPHGAQTEEETAVKLRNHAPALLVLGSLTSEAATVALVEAIRAGETGHAPAVPVIRLGERSGERELLRAFEAGCDDYVPKPFSYVELHARIRALIRRAEALAPRRHVIGSLVVDRELREARHAGQDLGLTPLEFDLLAYLAAEPTRVFTKAELLRAVWRFDAQTPTRTVDAHACRLRRKLADAGAPHLVQNARGVGYRLSAVAVPAHAEAAANGNYAVAA